MKITYQQGICFSPAQIKELYEDSGWATYTKDMGNLMQAISNSLCVLSAWEGDNLVGLIRVVGDGLTIVYIQDIIVFRSHKRRGIGTDLLNQIINLYSSVRQMVLLTDDSPETRGFYEANGFSSCDKGDLVSFTKFN